MHPYDQLPSNDSGGNFLNVTCPSCQKKIVVPDDASSKSADAEKNKTFYMMMMAICGLYLVYPSLGIFELIPDAIPVVGSLDEAAATAGLLYAFNGLGWLPSYLRPRS